MFCKECGKQIENDSKFCSFCGKQQSNLAQKSTSDNQTISDQPTSNFELTYQSLVNDIITKEYNYINKRFRVGLSDFDVNLDWNEAKEYCQSIGKGWRLPSIAELQLIRKELHLKGKGNFDATAFYWTNSDEQDDMAVGLAIYDGMLLGFSQDDALRVRAVKDI